MGDRSAAWKVLALVCCALTASTVAAAKEVEWCFNADCAGNPIQDLGSSWIGPGDIVVTEGLPAGPRLVLGTTFRTEETAFAEGAALTFLRLRDTNGSLVLRLIAGRNQGVETMALEYAISPALAGTLELGPIESENTLIVTREVVDGLGSITVEMNGDEFSTGATSLLGHPERIEQGILEFLLASPLHMFQRLPSL